jgi:hypothetical protein
MTQFFTPSRLLTLEDFSFCLQNIATKLPICSEISQLMQNVIISEMICPKNQFKELDISQKINKIRTIHFARSTAATHQAGRAATTQTVHTHALRTFGAAQLQHHCAVQPTFLTQIATQLTHSCEKTSTPLHENLPTKHAM